MDTPALSDEVQNILSHIRGDGDLRVWSVIVTIMGDMARGRGETVSGTTLGALMGALGIRPEATRVALHRLRKDGWITSRRAGRGSHYSLTDHGRAQTNAVAERIYGPGLPSPERWFLAVTLLSPDQSEYEQSLMTQGFTELAPGIFLGTSSPESRAGFILFSDSTPVLPDNIMQTLLPDAVRIEAQRFATALKVTRNLDHSDLTALSRAAIRLLILHRWRRIALRLPNLPLTQLSPDARLRTEVHEQLNRLGPIDANDFPA
ncbi:PaaX family transcriptional regulator [Aliiroseovarius sp. Z3]|uniref:PaaX family transcriptional regulator n=1 Tax=Aliiroseovarius sp. Z3 TaxID=2811402 RepID=UPI0023B29DE8|nr:PaaX family transcriptional regulator [Aliiroseovarius sp. Z3]MDE9450477.1 PaaX family transcriptional regulator [Aliiroseovarius sp. Z3]